MSARAFAGRRRWAAGCRRAHAGHRRTPRAASRPLPSSAACGITQNTRARVHPCVDDAPPGTGAASHEEPEAAAVPAPADTPPATRERRFAEPRPVLRTKHPAPTQRTCRRTPSTGRRRRGETDVDAPANEAYNARERSLRGAREEISSWLQVSVLRARPSRVRARRRGGRKILRVRCCGRWPTMHVVGTFRARWSTEAAEMPRAVWASRAEATRELGRPQRRCRGPRGAHHRYAAKRISRSGLPLRPWRCPAWRAGDTARTKARVLDRERLLERRGDTILGFKLRFPVPRRPNHASRWYPIRDAHRRH